MRQLKKLTALFAALVLLAGLLPALRPAAAEAAPITEPQAIADYIFANGCLPDNFITKKEAQALGWDSTRNYVGDVAPGKSIGGDRFGNYEGKLPTAKGRQYYECDCYYTGKKRNAYRIIYSNDGLVYYTEDHYNTFVQMFPSEQPTAPPATEAPAAEAPAALTKAEKKLVGSWTAKFTNGAATLELKEDREGILKMSGKTYKFTWSLSGSDLALAQAKSTLHCTVEKSKIVMPVNDKKLSFKKDK